MCVWGEEGRPLDCLNLPRPTWSGHLPPVEAGYCIGLWRPGSTCPVMYLGGGGGGRSGSRGGGLVLNVPGQHQKPNHVLLSPHTLRGRAVFTAHRARLWGHPLLMWCDLCYFVQDGDKYSSFDREWRLCLDPVLWDTFISDCQFTLGKDPITTRGGSGEREVLGGGGGGVRTSPPPIPSIF